MSTLDILASFWFVLLWVGYAQLTNNGRALGRISLSEAMNDHRRNWMMTGLRRDLRMIDTAILTGLQNGTAFFASTTILALGGSFAMLGATDQVVQLVEDLPLQINADRGVFELKIGGLIGIFAYSFFKFGWAYRLFNYSSILFGSIPMASEARDRQAEAKLAVGRAVEMNILGGKHFNAGLRAIFLSIGYLGWFISPLAFMASTTLVVAVLIRRQFFSTARTAALQGVNDEKVDASTQA